MEKVSGLVQENPSEILSEYEKECLKTILGSDEYKKLSNNEIKNKLNQHLLEKEKESIYEISAMDEKLKDLKNRLEELDSEFKTLEDTVDKQTNEFLGIIKDLSNCESQNKVIDIRLRNQQALKETLQMLVGETDFSKEELITLNNANLEDSSSIDKALKILLRLAKYIKNSTRFKANQFIVKKNQEYENLVENFELKLKDFLIKIANKATAEYKKKTENSLSFPETSSFRTGMKNLKKLYDIIFQIHDNAEEYISVFLKGFAEIVSGFINLGLTIFEKRWKSTILTFNLFKAKFSIITAHEISITVMNSSQSGDKKLSSFIQETITEIYNSIVSDEDYWPIFFGNAQKTYNSDHDDIKIMLDSIYSNVKSALFDVIEECKAASALSLFFFLSVVSNLIEVRKKEAAAGDNDSFENTYSYSFLLELSSHLTTEINSFSSEQIKSLEKYDLERKSVEILVPVKNLSLMTQFLRTTFVKNPHIYMGSIRELYDAIKLWIFKKSSASPRGKEVIIIENCYFLALNFGKMSEEYFATVAKEMMDLYEKTATNYVKTLFSQAYPEFWSYWSKIKDIADQADISGLQLSGIYSKVSFEKSVKSTFSTFSKAIEKMVSTIAKQITTEEGLAKNLFKKLSKFISDEYEEIETFAKRAYESTITPSRLEIQALMVEKQI